MNVLVIFFFIIFTTLTELPLSLAAMSGLPQPDLSGFAPQGPDSSSDSSDYDNSPTAGSANTNPSPFASPKKRNKPHKKTECTPLKDYISKHASPSKIIGILTRQSELAVNNNDPFYTFLKFLFSDPDSARSACIAKQLANTQTLMAINKVLFPKDPSKFDNKSRRNRQYILKSFDWDFDWDDEGPQIEQKYQEWYAAFRYHLYTIAYSLRNNPGKYSTVRRLVQIIISLYLKGHLPESSTLSFSTPAGSHDNLPWLYSLDENTTQEMIGLLELSDYKATVITSLAFSAPSSSSSSTPSSRSIFKHIDAAEKADDLARMTSLYTTMDSEIERLFSNRFNPKIDTHEKNRIETLLRNKQSEFKEIQDSNKAKFFILHNKNLWHYEYLKIWRLHENFYWRKNKKASNPAHAIFVKDLHITLPVLDKSDISAAEKPWGDPKGGHIVPAIIANDVDQIDQSSATPVALPLPDIPVSCVFKALDPTKDEHPTAQYTITSLTVNRIDRDTGIIDASWEVHDENNEPLHKKSTLFPTCHTKNMNTFYEYLYHAIIRPSINAIEDQLASASNSSSSNTPTIDIQNEDDSFLACTVTLTLRHSAGCQNKKTCRYNMDKNNKKKTNKAPFRIIVHLLKVKPTLALPCSYYIIDSAYPTLE